MRSELDSTPELPEGFRLRLAAPADAEQLGIIGPAIYAEAYGHMWSDAEAYAKQLATFGSEAVAAFMARSDARLWLIESKSHVVGFLSLVVGAPDPIEKRTDGAEVPRIYLQSSARGIGLGAKLVEQADRYARESGTKFLWLDAMREAPLAWQTYLQWGFEEIGETIFPKAIDPEFKPMVVMRRATRL